MPNVNGNTAIERANRVNAAVRVIGLNHRTLGIHALKGSGLHAGQEWVLEALVEQSPRSHAELAGWSGCEPPTVTSTVTKLEAAGYVTRTRRADDARVVDVAITDAGRAALASIEGAWIALAEATVGSLTDEGAPDRIDDLERIAERLRAAREATRT